MSEWRSIHLTQARQVAALMGVTHGLPAPEMSVRARYEALKAADPVQALTFLAHALPRFEAILWAASMLAQAHGPAPSREQHATRAAIRHWLDQQDDTARRAAYDSAQPLARDLPERSLAGAIFYGGGSIAPLNASPVLPVPGLANRLAALAVIEAAYRSGDAPAFIADALDQAEVVADHGAAGQSTGRNAA
ncbi:DUF6931 family protein [Novosphingobium rosa]|uniref:DUF6931 family protein n=1 Tax=Novosphingobium rosa TaxID=76978 RepID=UPI00082F51FA|nr:hypothetical protein [Novosphingobium rosa]